MKLPAAPTRTLPTCRPERSADLLEAGESLLASIDSQLADCSQSGQDRPGDGR